jgi:hypothetical protein
VARSELRELESALGGVARRVRRTGSAAAFRAGVEQRLQHLEAQVGEVKTRLNGLLFFIVTTVIGQVLLRLFA